MENLADLLPDESPLNEVALQLISIVNMDIEEEEISLRLKEIYDSLNMEDQLQVWDLIRAKGIEFGNHHKKMTTVIKEYMAMKF